MFNLPLRYKTHQRNPANSKHTVVLRTGKLPEGRTMAAITTKHHAIPITASNERDYDISKYPAPTVGILLFFCPRYAERSDSPYVT